ncbi:hypothetical protein OHB26_21690 [Nocardia sp. NBC_01503]|uniref:hypothetical protein n=1 Tax=Nocardia sp. NBC_01503 TaxID=2975997 RepID=UPI002E7AFAB3|nr:hypothetical protein [Nocardia sp. NBC_01503]WTL29599.1 hypothetical protein OHB26_21690 [Nocardia sp. NBC_01503]
MITRVGYGAFGLVAMAVCALVSGCGPATDDHAGHSSSASASVTSEAPQSSSSAAVTTTGGAAGTSGPGASVTVGEVPGNPNAAKAVQPWVRDLVGGDIEQLVRKCWTIEPQHVRSMYADKDGILAAVAQPGIDGQFAVIWKGPVQTVSVKRSEIASGYACPRVAPAGATSTFNEADARYTVQRYLSRWTGNPVDKDDVEGRYPLVCAGSVLANNPGRLTGTTAFGQLTSKGSGISDVDVSVPVTNSSGATQPMVFKTTIGPEGYCINDIN